MNDSTISNKTLPSLSTSPTVVPNNETTSKKTETNSKNNNNNDENESILNNSLDKESKIMIWIFIETKLFESFKYNSIKNYNYLRQARKYELEQINSKI